jgi:SAM-dependent methyltransferase
MTGPRRRQRHTSPRPAGRVPRPSVAPSSWDRQATWYDGWVGEHGSRYHQAVVVPVTLDLLDPRPDEQILDVGGGQGVLAPAIVAAGARYTGVDASPRLIDAAQRRHGRIGRFVVGDARRLSAVPGLRAGGYDAAVFMLSIQDMDPLEPIVASLDWALRPSSRVVIVMTHPAFRQPRHSGWGFDEGRKLTYRRIDSYLTPMAVPMKSIGGGTPTRSYHRPIGAYVNGLAAVGFAVDALREIADLPEDARPGKRPARGKADAEIPLFLALRARRGR